MRGLEVKSKAQAGTGSEGERNQSPKGHKFTQGARAEQNGFGGARGKRRAGARGQRRERKVVERLQLDTHLRPGDAGAAGGTRLNSLKG